MLAVASMRTVSSGFPGGGGIFSTRIGLSNTSSTAAVPIDMSTKIVVHLRGLTTGGRRNPYQTNSAIAPASSAAHSAAGDQRLNGPTHHVGSGSKRRARSNLQ